MNQQTAFDPDGLRAKYRAERDKRLRADGNDQYINVVDGYERFIGDPFVEDPVQREPLTTTTEVAIVGGGFGGLLTAVYLRKAGVADVRVIEAGGDFGGTWYWNRYPGAQCDVESYIYLPLLEELGYMPRHKYSYGDEILDYIRLMATRFDLYPAAMFQTRVTASEWNDRTHRWDLTTDRGDRLAARHLVQSTGILNRPKLPAIAGIETFSGHSFHTSRWDYAYTGGDATGNLVGLSDKRVGIIGTGATSVQAIPHLGASAGHLFVFQRTPSSIDVRNNHPTDPGWAASLAPGWQQERITNFNVLVDGGQADVDLVSDGWTDITRRLRITSAQTSAAAPTAEQAAAAMELADFEKMESIRARVDEVVADRATAEALKPYYRQFCKRPCFHDEYLQTFNRANVTLVDTDGKGVSRITHNAVVVGDVSYEVDCLIFASGFEVGTSQARRAGFETVGRAGTTLTEAWADGPRTFHGFHTLGFPNHHLMGLTQTGLSINFSLALHEQAKHIAYVIAQTAARGATVVETSEAAEQGWQDEMKRAARARREFLEACTPGYYNNEGHVGEGKGFTATAYGGGSEAFLGILRAWRAAGDLAGLELS